MSASPAALWVIEFNSPNLPKPLRLRLENSTIVGRHVEGETRQPDVDLSPYGAEDEGVSRQHLRVFTENERLLVCDLESGNGTHLNGVRLKPGEPHPLAHGDQLRLGRMRLDVQIILSPMYGSSVRKQASLQLHDQVSPGSGQLVLIVEDDIEIARALAQVLEQAGYTPRVSQDVVSAIRVFNQKRPAAIIIEQLLPEINGLEFCRYVRRDLLGNTLPVIVISAARVITNVNEVLSAGADIFLERPVSARELRHVISSLVGPMGGSKAIYTKHLIGTAPLKAIPPESRSDSAVLFVAGHSDAPITISAKEAVSFGRADGATGKFKKHVDLTRYDAVNFGVSRIHMILHHKNGRFYVEDAESINGTYVNGEPARPHHLVAVRNADEIRLGELRMYIYFLQDPEDVNDPAL